MPRPIKGRRIGFVPEVTRFKPAGVPLRILEQVSLSFEELEAVRLKDLEGFQQDECAERMGISRQTFQRVLAAARTKIADALANGKAISIEGGNFELARHRFRCGWDGHEWEVPFDEFEGVARPACPKCRRTNVSPVGRLPHGFGGHGGGRRRGRGWRRRGV